MKKAVKEIEHFIQQWPDHSLSCQRQLRILSKKLIGLDNIKLEFVARPGVTYSLRAARRISSDRPLFVMVDIIDDKPRWLSVCFYADMINDNDELGNMVPGGLLGRDGLCFDIEDDNEAHIAYITDRIDEAYSAAQSGRIIS